MSEPTPTSANVFLEQQLDRCIVGIEKSFGADAIGFSGPLLVGVDDIIRNAVEEKHLSDPRRSKLVVILTNRGRVYRGCSEDR